MEVLWDSCTMEASTNISVALRKRRVENGVDGQMLGTVRIPIITLADLEPCRCMLSDEVAGL